MANKASNIDLPSKNLKAKSTKIEVLVISRKLHRLKHSNGQHFLKKKLNRKPKNQFWLMEKHLVYSRILHLKVERYSLPFKNLPPLVTAFKPVGLETLFFEERSVVIRGNFFVALSSKNKKKTDIET